MSDKTEITEDLVRIWTAGSLGQDFTGAYLLDILTGEYSLEDAREDVLSFKKSTTS